MYGQISWSSIKIYAESASVLLIRNTQALLQCPYVLFFLIIYYHIPREVISHHDLYTYITIKVTT